MVESKVVAEWIAEGEARGQAKGQAKGIILARQQAVMRLLAKRFPPAIPADLAVAIQACTDSERLSRWFDAAVDAVTLEDFRQAMSS